MTKRKKIVVLIVPILIIVLIGVECYFIFRKQTLEEVKESVRIPDVKGLSYEEAVAKIDSKLHEAGITDITYSKGWIDSHTPFKVYDQEPKAGTTVTSGDEVHIFLYIGEGWDDTYYTVFYGLEGDMVQLFTNIPEGEIKKVSPGSIVSITTQVLQDADIHVYANEEEIEKTKSDSDGWEYSFQMPDNDVIITAEWYTKEEMNGEDGE